MIGIRALYFKSHSRTFKSLTSSSLNYHVLKPSSALRPWIKYYWTLQDNIGTTNEELKSHSNYDLVIPDGSTELIFNWGAAYKRKGLNNGDKKIIRKSCIVGQRNYSVLARRLEPTRLIGIKFKPSALFQLTGIPEVEFKNQVVDLNEFELPKLDRLEEALYQTENIHSCIQLLEQFFLDKLLSGKTRPKQLNDILTFIQNQDQVDLKCLHKQFELHPKKLERLFNQQVGLSPKNYLKVMRFKKVYKQVNRQQMSFYDQSFFDAGYYDQMHFIKEFKSFTGLSPSDYYKGNTAISDQILTDTIGQLKS